MTFTSFQRIVSKAGLVAIRRSPAGVRAAEPPSPEIR